MADITPAIATGKQIINGYGRDGFRIAGAPHDGSVIVFPNRTMPWRIRVADDLCLDSLAEITSADEETEVLLIGMGETMSFLPDDLRAALRREGIIADVMTTGAACRTFNVLLSEDRRVAAALIAVP